MQTVTRGGVMRRENIIAIFTAITICILSVITYSFAQGIRTVIIPLDASPAVGTLEARIATLEALLEHFSRDGNDVTIAGANLHIVNGTGTTTGTVNGLGNLIVGYNEVRGSGDDRTGSHNLVVGKEHNYSSFGGLVAGYYNTISGRYASVSGGSVNVAGGSSSSVSGGSGNEASGTDSSVSGGYYNQAGNTNANS